ncbi:MAG: hypothetical protein H6540_00565 [Bacteroidales bacterium]|nr:hypothetical protein [Bacteroidales bacterium]
MRHNPSNFRIIKTMAFGLVFLVVMIAGCEKYVIPGPNIDPGVELLFSTDILPIFTKNNCAACHPALHQPDFAPANAYTSLTSGGYINTDNPESSKLYDHLKNASSHKSKASEEEKLKILTWIQQGAKNN